MIVDKKEFFSGLGLLAGFTAILMLFFSPIFNGQNGLEYLDDLYNSISKGSAYYIPKVKKETDALAGKSVSATVEMAYESQAQEAALLFMKGGALVNVSGTQLKIEGDLATILANCLADADTMFINDGQAVAVKYGYNERQVLFNWWQALKSLEKDLKKQKQFAAAKAADSVVIKALEPAYNYYQIVPQKILDRTGVVFFSLVFYVVYTLWFGFAVMYLFEGWGLELKH